MRCYRCGTTVGEQTPLFHREVQTGHSVHYGRRGGGSSTYYTVKPFCGDCVVMVDRRPKQDETSFEVVVMLVLYGALMMGIGKCACS